MSFEERLMNAIAGFSSEEVSRELLKLAIGVLRAIVRDGEAKLSSLKDFKCLANASDGVHSVLEDNPDWAGCGSISRELGVYFWRNGGYFTKDVWGMTKSGKLLEGQIIFRVEESGRETALKLWARPTEEIHLDDSARGKIMVYLRELSEVRARQSCKAEKALRRLEQIDLAEMARNTMTNRQF